jgi:phospholipase C
MPSSVRLSNGKVVAPSISPDVVPLVDHFVRDQVAAIDHGKMDGWNKVRGCGAPRYICVSGYESWQVPNLASLASNFAISDNMFSMAHSPSWGGHVYAVASTLEKFTGENPPGNNKPPGRGWGCDSDKLTVWKPGGGQPLERIPACIPDPSLTGPNGAPLPHGGAFEATPASYVPTIMDRLNAAGLSWHIYGATCTRETVNAKGLELCRDAPPGYLWNTCDLFAECLYSQDNGVQPDNQFLSSAAAGTLPAFSVVTPGDAANSWHNGFSITAGDNWLGRLTSAVMNGPNWRSTAVFITWDDCGCFYDGVPPGINPDGTPQGPRVPMVIVSPYARRGYTDTTHTTLAGVLAYTEQNFGLPPLSENDAFAYNFANAFNYRQKPLKPVPMVTRTIPRGDHIDWSQALEDS